MSKEKQYTNVTVNRNDSSEVTLTAEIPAEHLPHYRRRALKELSEKVSVGGFRKGHVPEDILVKHVGEAEVLRLAATKAIEMQYPLLIQEVMEKEPLPIIGTPNVSITKLAEGNPIAFTITAALMPHVQLPDYTAIAKRHNAKREEVSVTDSEVDETLTHLRRERAKIQKIESGVDPTQATEEAKRMDTLELPGIDDTFVQSLGFANVDAFNTKLRENIGNEKTLREREKNRIAIIEDIVREARIPLPNILIEHELAEMEQQFSRDLAQGGTTLEKYLAQTNKSREDLHKEWYAGAEKRAKMHLVLREIAQKENISAPKEDVDKYVDQVLAQHKKADPEAVRTYYELNLRNEAVFRFLERV